MDPAKEDHVEIKKGFETNSKKEMRLFGLVMIVFSIGMAILLIYNVSAWWIWYIYFAIWALVEIKIARNIYIKWWYWMIFFAVIIGLDWFVLEAVEFYEKRGACLILNPHFKL